ncbi:intermediate conductance calcium-activated potassium channel protein 4 isoform X1 [Microcaecilia unicolor]|uniref:Intermediate conductance calcium-activated potassium channel protein 4 isoform X1 n=2 Tax=Microcaecilia unicolor TaxID=1415580 RepID=A0A6P7YW16_9AMPH|nr:intermediate conductance calcium-activated potassium channel protein 4 isoform X1 [Microcaecilia unicolor]
MGKVGLPLFTSCFPATPRSESSLEMQGRAEATEVVILNSKPARAGGRSRENLLRLGRRKVMVEERKQIAAWSLGLAIIGIVLMVLHTELLWFSHCKWFLYFFMVKCTISLSTGVLLVLIVAFHTKEIQLFMVDNSLDDWRIAVSARKLAWILLELVACAVHPFPAEKTCSTEPVGDMMSEHPAFLSDIDVVLSILMFLRIYLLPRTVLLYSRVLVDASYRSIGSLNKIKFQYHFVMKILMNTCPGRVLLILTVGLWVIASWILSVCERQNTDGSEQLTKAMWLIPITFLTIGYGDVVPQTVCGKVVCLCTGVMGVGCTALLVAVAAQKLEFSKAEKHVHNFMLDIKYLKQIKCAAANVLGEAWLLHKYKKRGESMQIRQHQRNLLRAIQIFRQKRLKHRKLQDQANALVDISKMQMIICDLNSDLNCSYRELEKRINSLDRKLDDIARLISATKQPLRL